MNPRSLVPFATPTININAPQCAKADCTEYIAAGVACATETATVNACYCSRLTWPTACVPPCQEEAELSSIASWYWDLCPSAMDSVLGNFGITHSATPAFTIDAWEIQAPTTGLGVWTSGFNCYFSGLCNFVSSPKSTEPPNTTVSSSASGGNLDYVTIVVAVLIPVIFILFAIIVFIWWKKRNSRSQLIERDEDRRLNNLLLDVILGSHQANMVAISDLRNSIQDLASQVAIINLTQQPGPAALPTVAPPSTNANPAPVTGASSGLSPVDRLAMIKNHLECPICLSIMHNPVSAISNPGQLNSSCCKSDSFV
jgi:hypothetical protein